MTFTARSIHDRLQNGKIIHKIEYVSNGLKSVENLKHQCYNCPKCNTIIVGLCSFLLHGCEKKYVDGKVEESMVKKESDVINTFEITDQISSHQDESSVDSFQHSENRTSTPDGFADYEQRQVEEIDNKNNTIILKKKSKYGKGVYICDYCSRAYNYKQSLLEHMLSRHVSALNVKRTRNLFRCDQCPKSYLRASGLKVHYRAIHKNKRIPAFECNYCGKKYAYKSTLVCHIQNTHIILGCQKEIAPIFKCKLCGSRYRSKLNYEDHMKMHESEESNIVCKKCNKLFKCRKIFERHVKFVHEEARPVMCSECNKIFKSERYLKSHMQLHGEGTHICPTCGRRYKNTADLNIHVLIHSKEKKFICKICDKAFAQPAGLAVHQREVHDKGVKDYPCRKCEKTFKSYLQRYNHEWKHNNPNGIDCDICGSNCSTRAYYHQHKKSVHGTAHVCSVCGYHTTTAQFLKQHMVKHTGEKPFNCSCGQTFAWKRTMDEHIKKTHRN